MIRANASSVEREVLARYEGVRAAFPAQRNVSIDQNLIAPATVRYAQTPARVPLPLPSAAGCC